MVYYVALLFISVDGGLGPGEAVKCPYEAAAIRRAPAMACSDGCSGGHSPGGEGPIWESSKTR
jgi:hypothetical protein